MNKEESDSTSNLKSFYKDAKTVSEEELDALLITSPIWTIVCVKEKNNHPYILLGDETPESRAWFSYEGESKDVLLKFLEWKNEGDKLYKKKARSTEELDYLRKVMLSYGCINELINDEESLILMTIVNRIALRWYRADFPEKKDVPEETIFTDEADSAAYVEMVLRYIIRLGEFIDSVQESMKSFSSMTPDDEKEAKIMN